MGCYKHISPVVSSLSDRWLGHGCSSLMVDTLELMGCCTSISVSPSMVPAVGVDVFACGVTPIKWSSWLNNVFKDPAAFPDFPTCSVLRSLCCCHCWDVIDDRASRNLSLLLPLFTPSSLLRHRCLSTQLNRGRMLSCRYYQVLYLTHANPTPTHNLTQPNWSGVSVYHHLCGICSSRMTCFEVLASAGGHYDANFAGPTCYV